MIDTHVFSDPESKVNNTLTLWNCKMNEMTTIQCTLKFTCISNRYYYYYIKNLNTVRSHSKHSILWAAIFRTGFPACAAGGNQGAETLQGRASKIFSISCFPGGILLIWWWFKAASLPGRLVLIQAWQLMGCRCSLLALSICSSAHGNGWNVHLKLGWEVDTLGCL